MRSRHQSGMFVSITPFTPGARSRSFALSGRTLAGLKLALILSLLLVAISGLWLGQSTLRLKRLSLHSELLEQDLAESQRQLQNAQERIATLSQVTEQLYGELGVAGAMVRNVQTYVGLEPDLGVPPTLEAPVSKFAFGGSGESDLPGSSVDNLALDLSLLVETAQAQVRSLAEGVDSVHQAVAPYYEPEEAKPQHWPVKGWISSAFGWRKSPMTGLGQQHRGIDIVAAYKTPVSAASPGRVVRAGWSQQGLGKHVLIDHGHGFHTLYAHLSEIHVKPGQDLRHGETLGLVGSTGNSTGPHLHFEVWQDYGAVDPVAVLPLQP